MPFSHHSHSGEFCPSHAQDSLEQMIQKAIEKGMSIFCLSEHMPRAENELYEEEIKAGVTSSSLVANEEKYFSRAIELREKYASDIKILIGFESEWIKKNVPLGLIRDSLKRYPWEFFVGPVHHLHGIPIDWNRELYLEARAISGGTDERLFEDYFDSHFEMLQSLKPTVVGHFDLMRLHCDSLKGPGAGIYKWGGVWKKIVRNLKCIAAYGGLLELNSAGLRKGLSMPYPSAEICQEFIKMNGRYCLSDDSHGTAHIGAKYEAMMDFVEAQGIENLYFLELAPDSTSLAMDSRFPRTIQKSLSLAEIKKFSYWQQ